MTKKIGLLFPGQGSQFVGMGASLSSAFSTAKKIFERADETLGYSISKICFEGPEEMLTQTLHAQPAIYVSSYAAFEVFKEKFPHFQPTLVAGHSLGEFSALAAAGFFSFEDGLKLVQVRAQAMEKAAKANPGTMAAVLGLSQEDCIDVAREAGAEVANFNAPIQTVLTGKADAIQRACVLAEQKGAKRAIQLKVSGAFHSSLMHQAQTELLSALKGTRVYPLTCSFIPNVTGEPNSDLESIKNLLGSQLISSVRWTNTMKQIVQMELTYLFEIGPGKVLKGLAKSCEVPISVQTFGTADDADAATKLFEGALHA